MARIRKTGSGFLRFLAFVSVVSAAWATGLVIFAESIPSHVDDKATGTDAIVVLTGGSGRVEEGLRLLSDNMAHRLFVSGVFPGMDVQRLLKLVQRDPRGLEGRIGIGNAADTIGNAQETADWVRAEGIKSIRLVTSSYHMPRAELEFKEVLPDVELIPHPVFAATVKQEEWWAWPGTALLIGSEYNKFLLAWLRHRVNTLPHQLSVP